MSLLLRLNAAVHWGAFTGRSWDVHCGEFRGGWRKGQGEGGAESVPGIQ